MDIFRCKQSTITGSICLLMSYALFPMFILRWKLNKMDINSDNYGSDLDPFTGKKQKTLSPQVAVTHDVLLSLAIHISTK